jgi:PIN domain nuclease of toxin-antitoxin system
LEHVEEVGALPLHHRDPFDRMLVAQARVEDLTLVTGDRRIAAYAVRRLWT